MTIFSILAMIHAMIMIMAAPPTLGRYSMTVFTSVLIGPAMIGRLSEFEGGTLGLFNRVR
jgi:hypothetical protein